MEHRFREAFKLTSANQQLANFNMTNKGDKQKKYTEWKIGTKVWLYVVPRINRADGTYKKFKYPWQGPYEIEKIISPNIVKLKNT